MNLGLLSLAFSAGVVTFFNPCAYAMLPAYISYHFIRRSKPSSLTKNLLWGVSVGGAVSLGFMAVFLAVGGIVSLVGAQIGPYLPWAAIVVGVALVVLGAFWLMGIRPSLAISPKISLSDGKLPFFGFGVGYAVASMACALPVFLMVMFAAVGSGGFLSGLLIFFIYSLGMVVVMIPLTIAVATSKNLVLRYFERAMPWIHKAGAVILVVAGLYLIFLQRPKLG